MVAKTNLEKQSQLWWLKVVVLLAALIGVFWLQKRLNTNIQPTSKAPAESEPVSIPAKVEFGK